MSNHDSTPKINPCSFKEVCKKCTIANLEDRPQMCVAIRCEHYTPCVGCKENRTLDPTNKLCNNCTKRNRKEIVRGQDGNMVEVPAKFIQEVENLTPESDIPHREFSLSIPGSPPAECSEQEKEYYNSQWREYATFYRDPTAKSVIHNIIVLEIELNWVVNFITARRGETPVKEHESQRTRIIANLSQLHSMLPKKEASDESDDERFLSMVYERYVQEKQLRQVGKVARLISPEALALAPALHFPIDPKKILTNLGYKLVDAVTACEHITFQDLPANPTQFLEWLGFFLNEKYALETDRDVQILPEAITEAMLLDDEVIQNAISQVEAVQPFEPTAFVAEFSE